LLFASVQAIDKRSMICRKLQLLNPVAVNLVKADFQRQMPSAPALFLGRCILGLYTLNLGYAFSRVLLDPLNASSFRNRDAALPRNAVPTTRAVEAWPPRKVQPAASRRQDHDQASHAVCTERCPLLALLGADTRPGER
jgi:hypothetical protein